MSAQLWRMADGHDEHNGDPAVWAALFASSPQNGLVTVLRTFEIGASRRIAVLERSAASGEDKRGSTRRLAHVLMDQYSTGTCP